MPKTLFEKAWESHVVAEQPGSPAILYIDLHLVHEVISPQAFTGLRQRVFQKKPRTCQVRVDGALLPGFEKEIAAFEARK